MGVHQPSHCDPDALTPICNECGISLCFDISIREYRAAREYWDAWRCCECNPNYQEDIARWKMAGVKEL